MVRDLEMTLISVLAQLPGKSLKYQSFWTLCLFLVSCSCSHTLFYNELFTETLFFYKLQFHLRQVDFKSIATKRHREESVVTIRSLDYIFFTVRSGIILDHTGSLLS